MTTNEILKRRLHKSATILGLAPADISISNVEAKLLAAGRYALAKLSNDTSEEADAAKNKFNRLLEATADIFPREIADDLSTEIFCRLRLSYGSLATSFLIE